MKVRRTPRDVDLQVAATLLGPCFDGLTPETLRRALERFDPAPAVGPTPTERLTTAELCARWRCTRQKVHNWVRAGRLRPLKIGRTVLFEAADVAAAEGEVQG